MLGKLHIILILLLLAGCGPRKAAKSAIVNIACPVEEPSVDQDSLSTAYKYVFFGKLGFMERTFREDTLVFPPIEGLVHRSAYAMCPTDTCVAEYAVLALRCPPIQPLLNWVADTVSAFVNECPIGNGLSKYNGGEATIPTRHLKSDKEICDYYIDQLNHVYDNWHCAGEGDHGVINEQAGLLLADCWNNGNLYTFHRIDWYDWLSSGNNTRESWWTVNARTGKLLSLNDMVHLGKRDSLSTLMMAHLVNDKGELYAEQYPDAARDNLEVLSWANGCALTSEGLVIYFYPYNLGSGADGEYEAIIPYVDLKGILKGSVAVH